MSFDFDAAVQAPFRMQPGLRRLAAHGSHLTPSSPGARHLREKLAVLSAFWSQALVVQHRFDAKPALEALCAFAASEHPRAWGWDGARAHAQALGVVVDVTGRVEPRAGTAADAGGAGVAGEVSRCLLGLPPAWRLAGLLSLAFAEDFALVDGGSGHIPWLAVCLPSHWAPEDKVGRHFAAVHAPVADNTLLLKAADSLTRLVCGPERWERFVWNVTDQPRLHAHPARCTGTRWAQTDVGAAWFRSERQTFIPLPHLHQAIFTIAVDVQPLAQVLHDAARARALHDAVASMSPAVLAYRGLVAVREPLLAWLAARADGAA